MLGTVRQQSRHVAGAGADFQHFFVLLHIQVLQKARFNPGGQHALTRFGMRGQRNFHVHKSQGFMSQRHKIFAFDHRQQGKNLAVEHLPGADLLLDHVKAGLFVIHGCSRLRQVEKSIHFSDWLIGAFRPAAWRGQDPATVA